MIGQVFGYFVILSTSCLCLVIYLFYISLIFKTKLYKKNLKYCLLIYKVLNVLLFSLMFVGFQNNNCQFCNCRVYSSYFSQYYSKYILKDAFHVLAMTEISLSILFNYEIFLSLKNTRLFKRCMPINCIYFILIVGCSISRIPDYLAVEIKISNMNGLYYLSQTWIAKTNWYFWYQIAVIFIFFFICIIIIIILSIINIFQYHKTMRQKTEMINFKNTKKIKKTEANFTRMIIISTVLNSIAILNS